MKALRVHGCGAVFERISCKVGGFTKGDPVRAITQLAGRDVESMMVSASQSSMSEEDGVNSLESGF
jgi:hypothetical protein